MSRAAIPSALALVFVLACGKSSGPDAPAGSGAASASAAPSSSSAAIASAAPSAAASTATATARAMKGTYKTTTGTLAVTPQWSKTKYGLPESSAGVGDGTLTLQIDAQGRVTGTLDGVVGAAVLEGTLAGPQLTAAVRRKDPTDRGFAGTLVGTIAGDKATGTLSLASAEGGLVRTGTFSASADGS